MTETLAPESVLDLLDNECQVGDRIAYAVRQGDVAGMVAGEVIGFQLSKEWKPVVKIKVKPEASTGWRDHGRPTLIDSTLKRFVKLGQA